MRKRLRLWIRPRTFDQLVAARHSERQPAHCRRLTCAIRCAITQLARVESSARAERRGAMTMTGGSAQRSSGHQVNCPPPSAALVKNYVPAVLLDRLVQLGHRCVPILKDPPDLCRGPALAGEIAGAAAARGGGVNGGERRGKQLRADTARIVDRRGQVSIHPLSRSRWHCRFARARCRASLADRDDGERDRDGQRQRSSPRAGASAPSLPGRGQVRGRDASNLGHGIHRCPSRQLGHVRRRRRS